MPKKAEQTAHDELMLRMGGTCQHCPVNFPGQPPCLRLECLNPHFPDGVGSELRMAKTKRGGRYNSSAYAGTGQMTRYKRYRVWIEANPGKALCLCQNCFAILRRAEKWQADKPDPRRRDVFGNPIPKPAHVGKRG